MSGSAIISDCQRYRYELRRWWNAAGQWVLWIMLNPSIADDRIDDRTIANICARSRYWGGERLQELLLDPAPPAFRLEPVRGVLVGNLYAFRAQDPLEMVRTDLDVVGPDNDMHLARLIDEAGFVMCAWGNGPWYMRDRSFHLDRVASVIEMIRKAGKTPYMLDVTAHGMPRHPLYWPLESSPEIYRFG